MFELVWDLAYGPTWLRVLQVVAIIGAVVALLVLGIYPAVYDSMMASISV